MEAALRDLVFTLLNDDEGISQDSWYKLNDFLQCMGEFELAGELARLVDACDNRYFVK